MTRLALPLVAASLGAAPWLLNADTVITAGLVAALAAATLMNTWVHWDCPPSEPAASRLVVSFSLIGFAALLGAGLFAVLCV